MAAVGSGAETANFISASIPPQRKAHPGLVVRDLASLAARLEASGASVDWDDRIIGVRRFFTTDPFGNRIEFRDDSTF